ncbi:hypothetical protein DL766_007923 [Monosporascus sp. MC13-8B]|uniref:Peptidase S8/S53 domain-containing protein n=1 Tax=Monosporascus cannonballus TaxID=155416 RepID=A0ABY0H9N8_9PEZI|nr:hypothetical protein DL762_005382 [Monosporascus cannonballus]RYO93665.1 hypothetical protein DL763_004285 [Monosporascus cannonballus]RYP21450.1 hypothetical protein DL766_007923 [Monosporascus sp. MC13-8B]
MALSGQPTSPFDGDDGMPSFDPVISRSGTWTMEDRAPSHPGPHEAGISYEEDANMGGLYPDEGEDEDYAWDQGHDALADENAQQLQPFLQPALDPEHEIMEARLRLKSTIFDDRDTNWKDEAAWKRQPNYERYRASVADLLEKERAYLAGTSSDQSPTNFLQHVLQNALSFYPHDVRLQKIKFLLQLIAELDPTHLNPKYGSRPLHAAAEVDIKLFKEDVSKPKPDITIYMCNLMKDKAADEICEVNDAKENILHLAILHDLKGVEDLIKMAGERAFIERRSSGVEGQPPNPDDGNTPLHDALDVKNFIRPVAACHIPAPVTRPPLAATRTASAAGPEPRRPSITQRPATTSDVPSAPQAHPTQQQVASNQARPRASAEPTPQGRQPRKVGPIACKICLETHTQNETVLKKAKNIIDLLLARPRGKDALTIHNSAGLSPYLYLYAFYHKWAEEQGARNRLFVANGQSPLPTPGINPTAGEVPADKGPGRDGSERTGKNATEINDALDPYIFEKGEKEKKQQAQRPDPLSRRQGESTAGTGGRGNQNVRGVREPVKNNSRFTQHTRKDLSQNDIGCKDILERLRGFSFMLGGYKKACQCLFRNQNAKGHSPFAGELGRQRRFSLEGNQRVKSDTTKNFNFLIFEPMMASVVLSLEYTQESLEILPKGEQEKVELWTNDEENLKKVFEWLKTTKGVKTILSLTVKDNPYHCCSDDTVEECLKDLEVLYLNWNRPNMCANKYTLPPTLVEVSLYWTGLNSVLWSWSDTEGLRTLERANMLTKIQGTEVEDKLRKAKVAAFQDRVNEWPIRKPIITVRDDDRAFRGGGKSGGLNDLTTPVHPWLQHVLEFRDKVLLAHYRDQLSTPTRQYHVKVALLDDGVDPTYERNGENLYHAGWPSVDSGEPEQGSRSFYVSTNQHGSKMAWLIRQVCPFVTIHVAKLDVNSGEGLRQRSFSLQQATKGQAVPRPNARSSTTDLCGNKAIYWAKDQGVDIISMSWNARRVSPATGIGNDSDIHNLERAIDDAYFAKILMFGAACDVKQSASSDKWVPCDNSKVFSIGATDMDFDVKKYVDLTKKVDYLFPGEYVLSQIEDAEVGNSGATALATGLAALVLFCMRAGGESLPADRHAWMNNIVAKVFDSETNKKVVHVKDVLRMDKQRGLPLLVQKFASQKG